MLVISVRYRFNVDADGIVTWFRSEWDFTSTLTTIVSTDAICILNGAIILSTYQISATLSEISGDQRQI
ncbi:hypothetical protein Plhal304r1_c022g0076931 [Plasmopara halstedii]